MSANMVLIQPTYQDTNSIDFRKKENITKKARSIFSKYGTQPVSMNDIADQCKISKKTIYTFWDSKELLLTEIVAFVLAENSKAFDKIQADSLDPKVEIQKLFDILQNTIKVLTPCFLSDLKAYYPGTYHLVLQFHDQKLRPFLVQNFRRGIHGGVYRSNLENELLSILYCWQLQNIYEAASLPIDGYKLLSHTNALFLQGIICNSKDVL